MAKQKDISKKKDGLTVLHISSTELNDDWMKANRLRKKKDKKSKEEFERMDNNHLVKG